MDVSGLSRRGGALHWGEASGVFAPSVCFALSGNRSSPPRAQEIPPPWEQEEPNPGLQQAALLHLGHYCHRPRRKSAHTKRAAVLEHQDPLNASFQPQAANQYVAILGPMLKPSAGATLAVGTPRDLAVG